MGKDYTKENTAPSADQMQNSVTAYYLGNPMAKKKILIVGNSITWHAPKEEIGWFGNWGMAEIAKAIFAQLKKRTANNVR